MKNKFLAVGTLHLCFALSCTTAWAQRRLVGGMIQFLGVKTCWSLLVSITTKAPSVEEIKGIPLRAKIYRDPKRHKCEGQFPQTKGIETGNEKRNVAHRDHVWKLGSNASHITVFGWLILFAVFSSEVLSSSRESLLSHQGRRTVFRKIFNFTVQRNKYYLCIGIIRTGDKTCFKYVWALYYCRYCLSKHLESKPWSSILDPLTTIRMGFLGTARGAATVGSYGLHSLGCNKNFTIFCKGAISDPTNKWAKIPTSVKFFINIFMRKQNHTSNI